MLWIVVGYLLMVVAVIVMIATAVEDPCDGSW